MTEYGQFYAPCVWAWGGKQMAVINWMHALPCPFLVQKSSLHRVGLDVQAALGFVGRICSNIFDMKKQPAR